MTCRPLLWIAASAVTVGALAWSPAQAGAEDLVWNVSIDAPAQDGALIESRNLVVTGDATLLVVGTVEEVTITAVPQSPLPPDCRPASDTAPVTQGRYQAELEVACNGPYELQAVARRGQSTSGVVDTRRIGVAEKPEAPGSEPAMEAAPDGGIIVSAPPTDDLDAAGWILMVNMNETFVEAGVGTSVVASDIARSLPMVAVKAVRWGAGGPGVDRLPSDPSLERMWVGVGGEGAKNIDSPIPQSPVGTIPSPGPGSTQPPAGTSPPTTADRTPTRGRGSPATLPEGYDEELPYGVPDDAFVPGEEPRDQASATGDESAAAGTPAPAGLVRTTEKRNPGLVAPFALGLLMITIAAHIAWYLRRSKPPTDGGQVTLL